MEDMLTCRHQDQQWGMSCEGQADKLTASPKQSTCSGFHSTCTVFCRYVYLLTLP
jgi:hypothetical protein